MTLVTFDFDRVELTDVSRHFGRRRAVSRVSLSLQAGEILGLLGPNGAGKSTLIGMLATLVAPTSGDGHATADATARELGAALRGRIGLLAHELHLYPELTARQNLEFFARLYGLDAARRRRRRSRRPASRIAATTRCRRSRAACVSASRSSARCCTSRGCVLLDEPFTGLDDRAVELVADRLRRLAADGAIVVLATHDLDLADGLVTRVGRRPRRPAAVRTSRRAPDSAQRYRARWWAGADDVLPRRAARAEEGLRHRG